ncbi:hypothetical protein [Gordonia sp. KTR9]|uniref:hypothetical protein n=1 Tax=Gordonia sp. KTR9 TaxID=337191 RepID=UPI0002F23C52|nr:hypothetical protein [Gordonia sp. KTR9]
MAEWACHWVKGDTYEIVNNLGRTATGVRLSTHGPMVAAGTRDWSREYGDIEAGRAISQKFKTGMGRRREQAFVLVEWNDDKGRHSQEIPFD